MELNMCRCESCRSGNNDETKKRLITEFHRLERISPNAMVEINKYYDKSIIEYTCDEIKEIIIEILNYNSLQNE
jgi:hypothetical protein